MNINNYFAERKSVKKVLRDAENDVIRKCYYCKSCKNCDKFYSIKSELEKKGFFTFNKQIKYWGVKDPEITNAIESLKLGLSEVLDLGCKTP